MAALVVVFSVCGGGSAVRVLGLKVVPLLLAAFAVYFMGFLIYGALLSEQWMALAGFTVDSFAGQEWRMALGPVMPIMITLGIGLLIKERGITTLVGGLKLGAFVGAFFLVTTRLYTFAYGIEPFGLLAIDSLHLMLNGLAAGGVLGAMKAAA
jgi:Protein of unknown function (DUF1761)